MRCDSTWLLVESEGAKGIGGEAELKASNDEVRKTSQPEYRRPFEPITEYDRDSWHESELIQQMLGRTSAQACNRQIDA